MESTNLNVLRNAQEYFADNSIKTREVSFVDDISEELFGYKPKNQVQSEMHRHVKVHAHTCLSCLNPDDRSVDSSGPTVNKQTDGQDSIHDTTPMCLLNSSAPHGSCLGRSDPLLPRHLSEGDQMMATMTEGENENHLLQQSTIQLTTGSACPLPSGNLKKNWFLQEDGSYKPVFSE